jgi:hypothetical protein
MKEKTEWQKKAESEAYRLASGQCGKEDSYESRLAFSMFLEGAEWQRKAVWHPIEEKIDLRKSVLFTNGSVISSSMRFMIDVVDFWLRDQEKKAGIKYDRWAYADELLPINSMEI